MPGARDQPDARSVADASSAAVARSAPDAEFALAVASDDEIRVSESIRWIELDDALVVPAGTILRGHVSARALLVAGEIIGTVHCGAGPVVIRKGASLKGQLIAGGDVHVCGSVVDYAGGTVISTPACLVLVSGARVEGDVRSGRLEIHEGATLHGVARGVGR
jgi:cytoskeletal protein CcmA (bactofilin family)